MVKTNKHLGDPGASLFLRSKKKEEEMGGRSSGEGKLLSKKRRGILRRTENEK